MEIDIKTEKQMACWGLIFVYISGIIAIVILTLSEKSFTKGGDDLFLVIALIILILGTIFYGVSIYRFSKKLNNGAIFTNFLRSLLIFILTVVIIFAIFFIVLTTIMGINTNLWLLANLGPLGAILVWIIGELIIRWIGDILSSLFAKKYLDIFYEYTKEALFRVGGYFIYYGALTGIILIGYLFMVIGWLLVMAAFFKMPNTIKLEKLES